MNFTRLTIYIIALLKAGTGSLYHPTFCFHRDEFLYLALGRNLDFGYWSNPPMIGWLSGFTQFVFGAELWAFRLVPALMGAALVLLGAEMAKMMGGKKYAQILAALAIACSPAQLRTFLFFMPVPVDVLLWTLCFFFWMKYVNTESKNYLFALGGMIGLAMLNKYSIPFLVLGFVLVLPFTKHRKLFQQVHFYQMIGIGFLVFLPNLIWQVVNDFPVLIHMAELQRNQLNNIQPIQFLTDQIWMHLLGMLIWLPGLVYLLLSQKMRAFQHLAWVFILVVTLFILFSGKHYYTLGLYPVLFAAGACAWEYWLSNIYLRALPIAVLLLNLYIGFPAAIPMKSAEEMKAFFDEMDEYGLKDIRRWEDGRYYQLPQDFADMLGWEELAGIVEEAYAKSAEPEKTLIYAENYGQAGSIERFAPSVPKVASFSDTYRLWVPRPDELTALIYVNDELGEDVAATFRKIELIGQLEHPFARERGTSVYLCEEPISDFGEVWKNRVLEVIER